jgi:hypothetical protein
MPHSLGVHVRAEDVDPALGGPEGLETLEDALTIVEGGQGGQYLDLAEGDDLRLLPFPVSIVHLEHVIGEGLPEAQMVEVDRTNPALLNLTGLNLKGYRLVPHGNTDRLFETVRAGSGGYAIMVKRDNGGVIRRKQQPGGSLGFFSPAVSLTVRGDI